MDVVKHLFYPFLSFNPTYCTVTHSLPQTGSNWVQIGSFWYQFNGHNLDMNWGLCWLFSPPLQNKCIGKMSSNSTPTGLNLKLGKLLEQQTQLYRRSWIILVRDSWCCNIKSGKKLNQIISLFQSWAKFKKKNKAFLNEIKNLCKWIDWVWKRKSYWLQAFQPKSYLIKITSYEQPSMKCLHFWQ